MKNFMRYFICSVGLLFIAASYPIPLPGTSGNVLTSDGSKWTSAAATSSPTTFWVSANIAGANFDLGTSNQAAYIEMTNAGMTLTNQSGATTAQIACASGTASSGTTCTAANESNGIAFTITATGAYMACVGFSHYLDDNSGVANMNLETTFQIVETSNTSSAVTTEGHGRIQSGLITNSAAGGEVIKADHPLRVCALFNFGSTGQKTLRLEYEQFVSGTTASNLVVGDANASYGQRDIQWIVYPL